MPEKQAKNDKDNENIELDPKDLPNSIDEIDEKKIEELGKIEISDPEQERKELEEKMKDFPKALVKSFGMLNNLPEMLEEEALAKKEDREYRQQMLTKMDKLNDNLENLTKGLSFIVTALVGDSKAANREVPVNMYGIKRKDADRHGKSPNEQFDIPPY